MQAYASINNQIVGLCQSAAQLGVFRYFPGTANCYEYLSNITVLEIVSREGAEPGLARFRYVFNPGGSPSNPWLFQQVLSVDTVLPGVVLNDDRVVVLKLGIDGTSQILFDGFAQVPELGYGPSQEIVEFLAYGVSIREWDNPILGCLMRDSDDLVHGANILTGLSTRFNPNNQPNATPVDADSSDSKGLTYPVFLDPLVIRNPDGRRYWTLSMAVKYLCSTYNSTEQYVQNPHPALLDLLLNSEQSEQTLFISDYCATGKPWPVALTELLKPNGFGMAFLLETDVNGEPISRLNIFHLNGRSQGLTKDLFLQNYGETLDLAQTNFSAAKLARDTSRIANAYFVDSAMTRYEASFILAPGFAISGLDSTNTDQLSTFSLNHGNRVTIEANKYRLFVFDETGDGHWNRMTNQIEQTASSLESLLAVDVSNPAAYVKRRRIPLPELLTCDTSNRPIKAQLAISTDYKGNQPDLWDGSGHWQIVMGGFELLSDRLGVWLNVPNPNGWNIGLSKDPDAPYPAGVVRVVEGLSQPGTLPFTLRLTCVIEGDHPLDVTVERRESSPTKYSRVQRIDAKSRFLKTIKAAKSVFNSSSLPMIVRDDTVEATVEAQTKQVMTETGVVSGTVVLPRLSLAYAIGDRIRSIRGRNLSLRTNAGAPSVEDEVYPTIIGRIWDLNQKQRTLLQLSDQRS